jgi:hypothetical protein
VKIMDDVSVADGAAPSIIVVGDEAPGSGLFLLNGLPGSRDTARIFLLESLGAGEVDSATNLSLKNSAVIAGHVSDWFPTPMELLNWAACNGSLVLVS